MLNVKIRKNTHINVGSLADAVKLKNEALKYLNYIDNTELLKEQSKKIDKNLNRLFTNRIKKLKVNSINEFSTAIKNDYSNKNKKHLDYLINRLLYLRSDAGEYIFKIKDYQDYINVDEKLNVSVNNDVKYLKNKDRTLAYKQYSKVKYLEYYNQNKLSVFLTLTCPSKYHFFTKKHNGKNPNCVFNTLGDSIENSFIFQKELNREFYKTLKKKLSRKNKDTAFDYIRMFETHNKKHNLTIHSHSVFYVDLEQYLILQSVYYDLVKKYNLKQTKLITLNSSKSSSYVMKYIIKNLNEDNSDNFYNELKRYYSNHKLFTCSNYKHTTQEEINKVYTHLKINKPKLFEKLKNSTVPLYVNIEKYIQKNLIVEYEEKTVNKTEYSNTNNTIENILSTAKNHINIFNKHHSKKIDAKLVFEKLNTNNKYITLIEKSLKKDIKSNSEKITVKQIKSIKYKKSNLYIYESGKTFLDFDNTNIFKKQGLIQ